MQELNNLTLDELIENLLSVSYKKYKKISQGCEESYKLNRKIPVIIDNIEFTGWYEYTCYKVCEYLKDKIPEISINLILNGNDSSFSVELNDKEENQLKEIISNILSEWKE